MPRYVSRCLTFTLLAFLLNVSIFSQTAWAQPNGESLFKANCTSCHSVSDKKVVGPGLKDVHKKLSEDWLIKWIRNSQAMVKAGDPEAVKIYEEYNKTAMPAFGFKDDEIKGIIAYIKAESEKAPAVAATGTTAGVSDQGTGDTDKSNTPLVLILVTLVLIGLYLILNRVRKGLEALSRQREGTPEPVKLKGRVAVVHWIREHKKLIALIVVILTVWSSVEGWNALSGIGVSQGYQPEQPIKFSHKLHAGQNKIDCRYCHSGAEKSKNAGIPSLNVCMNCHKYVTEGPNGKDEIAKIYEGIGWDPAKSQYTNPQKPMEWVRIHNLPDFAYFNHSQHVKVAGLDCQNCHGPVPEMETMYQFSPLTMGWCVNCHRETEVKMDGNGYYTQLHETLKKKYGPEAKMTVDKIGGLECARCHY